MTPDPFSPLTFPPGVLAPRRVTAWLSTVIVGCALLAGGCDDSKKAASDGSSGRDALASDAGAPDRGLPPGDQPVPTDRLVPTDGLLPDRQGGGDRGQVDGSAGDGLRPDATPRDAGSDGPLPRRAHALFDLAATTDFYALPFPFDLRLRADGTLDLTGYPAPTAMIADYVETFADNTRGFGTSAAAYFRCDGALDEKSLPKSPSETIAETASAFIIDVTASSPTFGKRALARVHYQHDGGNYIGPDWVAILPFQGMPLRPDTTYAAVLTRAVRAADGLALEPSPEFAATIGDDPPISQRMAEARAAMAPLLGNLTQLGLRREDLAVATVFTTSDPVGDMFRLRQAVMDTVPAPQAQNLELKTEGQSYDEYQGSYDGPIYQQGTPPYATPDQGGGMVFAADGTPQLARMESLRFALTIPKGSMPAGGWPIVLYAHGTGGNYRSYISEGVARVLSDVDLGGGKHARFAVIGIDQVLHGPRDPSHGDPALLFYNPYNPLSTRDNVRQGGVDNFQLERLVWGMNVTAPGTGATLRFDRSRTYFFGHSQGGTTGPPYLAAEPEVKATVLSGAGAHFATALLTKTKPVNLALMVQIMLGDGTLDVFHPFLNLMQTFAEPADAGNYGRLFALEPPAGFHLKHVFQSEGLVDHYAPPETIEAFAVSMALSPVTPVLQAVEGLTLLGLPPLSPPVSGNHQGGGESVTTVLLQYPQKAGRDGHYVIFDVQDAIRQYSHFLGWHADSGMAKVVPPAAP